MQLISYNSCILATRKRKLFTYDRVLCNITFALSQYDVIIIDSKLPISFLPDQYPTFSLSSKRTSHIKTIFSPNVKTKLSNLQIIHTAGTNLTVAGMLRRD